MIRILSILLSASVAFCQIQTKDETFGVVQAFYLSLVKEHSDFERVSIHMYRSPKAIIFLKKVLYLGKPENIGFVYYNPQSFSELRQSEISEWNLTFENPPKRIKYREIEFTYVDSLRFGPAVTLH